ncbi:MAG TPA: HIGH nucleotidyl transferase [Ruminococcaceae bacterium]|nr:HIGH nucleotidyl transferase [Oscillospiraceae bacterium]
MMFTAGIIAEYNPFHTGHLKLIESLKDAGATHIAVVMSGDFVQRGEAAVMSKRARAAQAVSCGADLVAELPLPWSVAGAEKFAAGGISLLNAVGADAVGFGSESGSIAELSAASEALFSPGLHENIKKKLACGATFAAARQAAVEEMFGKSTAGLLRQPNNILGIEYLKAIKNFAPGITPFTVKRGGAAHDAAGCSGGTPSSRMLRKMLSERAQCEKYIPKSAYEILKAEVMAGRAPASLSYLERGMLAKLRQMGKADFRMLPDISEGLENRVFSAVRQATSLDGLYSLIKTKRYTHARVRRIVLSAFLGVTAPMAEGLPPYTRVLAIGRNGAGILHKAKEHSALPIVTRFSDIKLLGKRGADILRLENKAADTFSLCLPQAAPCGADMTAKIITADSFFA